MKDVHVLPIGDLLEHEETRECWCRPRIHWPDDDIDGIVVIHQAEDGRELVEEHGVN